MPRASVVVIASVPRKYLALVTVVSASLVILGIGIAQKASDSRTTLHAAGHKYSIEVVTTPEDQAKGLSGRQSLPKDRAMIFSFSDTRERCFWMKDMRFNIDMVWLDETKKVAAIERNLSPASYPNNFCHDGRHVIEFAADEADAVGIKIGDQISW